MIGKTIGKYTLTRLIGQGGMASVYEAKHDMLGTRVAIKILNPILSSNLQVKERFINEAKIMASLEHPNITKVIDFDEQSEQLSIVMEYLNGEDLNAKIKTNGPLPTEVIIDIFSQTLAAFQYAHEHGIVHRDVKPSNIFILTNGQVKILDFGIAKLFGQGMEMTQTGTQIGTPSYMSPEQVKAEKYIDHRSDIYALGVTLFCAASGAPPYDSSINSHYSILNKIVIEPLPALATNVAFQPIISKACQKNRELRYQSCNEFVTFLSRVRFEQTEVNFNIPHHSHNQQRVNTEPPVIPMEPVKKKQPLTLMIGAAAAVILIAVGVIYWNNSSKEPTQVSVTENTSGKGNNGTVDDGVVKPYGDEKPTDNNGNNNTNGKRQGKDEKPPVKPEDKPTDDAAKIKALEKEIENLEADLKKTNDKINKLVDNRDAATKNGDRDKEQAYEMEVDRLVNKERKPKAKKIGEKKTELKKLKERQQQ